MKGGGLLEQGRTIGKTIQPGWEKSNSNSEADKKVEGIDVDVGTTVAEEEGIILKKKEHNTMQGGGVTGSHDIKSGAPGSWKRKAREVRISNDQSRDGNKEDISSSGMKRVRVPQDETGKQQQEECSAKNNKCPKLDLIPHNPMVEVASHN